jgi:hypothetical protein
LDFSSRKVILYLYSIKTVCQSASQSDASMLRDNALQPIAMHRFAIMHRVAFDLSVPLLQQLISFHLLLSVKHCFLVQVCADVELLRRADAENKAASLSVEQKLRLENDQLKLEACNVGYDIN